MPYTIPTAAELKARYPAFASVADAYVDAIILEASGRVDSTWREADYQPAIMALAGHTMTVEGVGDDVSAQLKGFKRLKVGPLELERDLSLGKITSDLQTTVYGQRYLTLLRLNKPGVAVAKAGEVQT